MKRGDWLKFLVCLIGCQLVGVIGGLASRGHIDTWYVTLRKPPFNPPAWVFAPVWTVLYVLMGIAAFLVWRRGFSRRDVKIALAVFVVQLVLNALWSPVFFNLHSIAGALVIVMLLVAAVGVTIWRFAAISDLAAGLMWPYLLWVCFATVLNASLLVRNISG